MHVHVRANKRERARRIQCLGNAWSYLEVHAGLKRAKDEGKRLGRPPIAPELENRIREALNKPGRTEGVRKIAERFGVNPGTVQRISRPFDDTSVAAA
jgi:hypothetical protein